MTRSFAWILATVGAIVGDAGLVRAGVIHFEKSWTGAELAADPAAEVPGLVPSSLDGSTLQWGTVPNNTVPPGSSGAAYVKLIEIPLVPAGVLAADAPVRVTLDYQLKRNTAQFGPALTLFDDQPQGFYYRGPRLRTSVPQPGRSETRLEQGRISDTAAPANVGDFSEFESGISFAPYADLPTAPPDTLTGQMSWDFATNRFGSSIPANDSMVYPDDQDVALAGDLDFSRALSFAFWLAPADDASGGIASLSIRVEEVPEPASIAAAIGGALAAAMVGRRRRSHDAATGGCDSESA